VPGSLIASSGHWVYPLSGRMFCALCGHRMQGSFNHDAIHYRCKFTADRAPVSDLEHPKSVYVRESLNVPKMDRWLAQLFDPPNIENTVAMATVEPIPANRFPAATKDTGSEKPGGLIPVDVLQGPSTATCPVRRIAMFVCQFEGLIV
jgi:hypothetical protein